MTLYPTPDPLKHHDPDLQQVIRALMDLLHPVDQISSLPRDETYRLWNRALFVKANIEVYCNRVHRHFEQLSEELSGGPTGMTDDVRKIVHELARRGLDIDTLMKTINDKD